MVLFFKVFRLLVAFDDAGCRFIVTTAKDEGELAYSKRMRCKVDWVEKSIDILYI
jgi:hypothetical protein